MHKRLVDDLTSLAHSILKIKNKEDVFLLKEKAHQVYEKLALLAYVEEYIETTPNADEDTKKELLHTIKETVEKLENKEVLENEVEMSDEEKDEKIAAVMDDLFSDDSDKKNDIRDVGGMDKPTLEEELEDTLPVDVAADLFEKAATVKKSLNDNFQKDIQIGLNDRIAFVKNLFDGNQEDFNRVVSQLNTFKTEKEAKKFINKIVKPDYNWLDKEEYEMRFLEIIERKFS